MAIYWPTPGFKGRTFTLCVLTRWDFNFCVRSSPLRVREEMQWQQKALRCLLRMSFEWASNSPVHHSKLYSKMNSEASILSWCFIIKLATHKSISFFNGGLYFRRLITRCSHIWLRRSGLFHLVIDSFSRLRCVQSPCLSGVYSSHQTERSWNRSANVFDIKSPVTREGELG